MVDPLALAVGYYEALARFDLEAAAACFSEDVFYSHPPYGIGPRDDHAGRHEVVGRDALLHLWRETRGDRPVRTTITASAQQGDVFFYEGISSTADGEVVASFVSSARLDEQGLFKTYAAYSSIPPVGHAAGVSQPADAP